MLGMASKDGYSRFSIASHWIAAIIVVALFVTHEGEPRSTAYVVHVSGGAIAGVFLLWRVWHRVRFGMAERPDQGLVLDVASRSVHQLPQFMPCRRQWKSLRAAPVGGRLRSPPGTPGDEKNRGKILRCRVIC